MTKVHILSSISSLNFKIPTGRKQNTKFKNSEKKKTQWKKKSLFYRLIYKYNLAQIDKVAHIWIVV